MFKKFVLTISVLLAAAGAVFAQDIKVSGTVTDESGLPVTGANVVLLNNKTVYSLTGPAGEFELTVPSSGTLLFSCLGYEDVSVPVNGRTKLNVVLKEDKQLLDETVVVAYGTQKAKTVTAAVSTIKSDVLKDAPNVSFDAMLQGQAAGVQVSTPNAGAGASSKVLIRGVSSISAGTDPLYIVDGVPILNSVVNNSYTDASALADINPADILSIDVLKDAAATALYGSRAASGVVIITTKQGRKGEAKVTYDMNFGIATPTKTFKMMDAQTYTDFKNLAVANRYGTDERNLGIATTFGKKAFNLMTDGKGNTVDTDWGKLIYKNGQVMNHTVAISGGTDKTQYYVSANYSSNGGIIIGDNYRRAGIKANATTQVNNWLKIGLSAQYTNSATQVYDASRQDGVFAAAGLPRMAIVIPPSLTPYNDDGSYYTRNSGQYIGQGGITASITYPNPMACAENFNKIGTTRMIASGFVELTPVKNLTLKSQYGIDYLTEEEETFWSPNYGQGAQYPGYAFNAFSNSTNWTWTNTADYNLILGDHSFNFLAGMEANEEGYNFEEIVANTILNPAYTGIKAGYSTNEAYGALGSRSIISYFGRINYDYKSKYMLSLNFRRDGLSALGTNNKWGNFWGVSAAWRVSEEDFFAPLRATIDEFKIKASYGIVGNSEIGYYSAQTYYSDAVYGGSPALGLDNIGDASLAWENSAKLDVGFSLGLWNRVTIDFDYYRTQSNNLVFAVPQGPSTGIGSLTTNAGSLENKGIELTIGATVIKTRDFSWETNFNFTTAHNKVLELAEGVDEILGSSESNITLPGYSIGQLYLYPTGGIDPATGGRIFYGPNGEKTIFSYPYGWYLEDGTEFMGDFVQVRAGNTIPTYFGGWTNTFRYKGFDLNLMLQYSGGNYIYNGNTATGSDYRWWNNFAEVGEKSWKKAGDNAKYAKPVYGDNYSNGSAMDITDWIERGDYLRLKNLSLGYTFRAAKAKAGFSAIRVYGQVQNAFVLTAYTGLDPEITSSYSTAPVTSGGYDKNTLTQARTWTLGAQLTF